MLVVEFRAAIIALEVEEVGFAHALTVGVNDGDGVRGVAVEADVDFEVTQIAWGFVALPLEVEGVIGSHFSGVFEIEEFFVVRRGGEEALAAEMEPEAVEGFHP